MNLEKYSIVEQKIEKRREILSAFYTELSDLRARQWRIRFFGDVQIG